MTAPLVAVMDPASEKAVIAVQSVIVIVALVGNSLVCAVILKNRGMRYVKFMMRTEPNFNAPRRRTRVISKETRGRVDLAGQVTDVRSRYILFRSL